MAQLDAQVRGRRRLPIGGTPDQVEAALAEFDRLWGSDELAALLVPSRAGDTRP